jgi:cytochrome c oxidase subunit 3
MSAPVLDDKPVAAPAPRSGGPGGFAEQSGGDGEGSPGIFGDPARFGLWAFLGTVSMLFIGFTSAYIVRRSGTDWRPISPPPLLWINTAVLIASSVTLERARRLLRTWDPSGTRTWLAVAGLLGALFVAGQLMVWRRLAGQGIFLASNPHSSFFYVLTGLHALHLAGGLVWFGVVLAKLARMTLTPGNDGLRLLATYWHFLGALWIYLVLLLFLF